MDKTQILTALRNADAAGDTEAAKRLAVMARDFQAPEQVAQPLKQAQPTINEEGGLDISISRDGAQDQMPEQQFPEGTSLNPNTGQPLDIPTDANLQLDAERAEAVPKLPEGSMLDSIIEPVQAIGGALAGQVVGGLEQMGTSAIHGLSGKSGYESLKAGVDAQKSREKKFSEFNAPETQAGQDALQTVGDLMKSGIDLANIPLSGLGMLSELVSGNNAEQALETLNGIQKNGFGKTAGKRAYEVTGNPILAGIAEASPEIIGGLIPIAKMAQSRSALKTKIADKIKSGSTDKALTEYMLKGSNSIKKDKLANEAVKQGFDQGVIMAVKGSSKLDKRKMIKMLDNLEKGKENALFSMKNRPSDIAGDSLIQRVNHVRQTNRTAGRELDGVAKSLKGQTGNFTKPIDSFKNNLDEMGVTFDAKNRPIYKGSDIEGLKAPQKAINNVVGRLKQGKTPDAYDMHRMKRFIDENVTYGGKAGEGLKGKTENILKKLRKDLDSELDNKFPKYNDVNTRYADTVNALNALQDVAGKKMNLQGANADKATGTLLRRMMSNAQSRVNLYDAVDQLEGVAKKYGGKFDDDISSQMLFVDELNSVFGSSARTSLAGETGKAFKKGAEAMTGQKSISGIAIDKGSQIVDKFKGVNEEAALKTIRQILERD